MERIVTDYNLTLLLERLKTNKFKLAESFIVKSPELTKRIIFEFVFNNVGFVKKSHGAGVYTFHPSDSVCIHCNGRGTIKND